MKTDLETFLCVSSWGRISTLFEGILYFLIVASCGHNTNTYTHTLWFPADDDNLIILDPILGQEDCQSDYINASYVDVS